MFALHATAATTAQDFDHNATGFPLNGLHAATPCETCHVGGVFKGTEKTCEACHSLGKKIVATPKPRNHIVTDAPCETCHFNAYTFLGARYNHGTAQPGQCITCHNGNITTGRPANHSSGLRATNPCDRCHRSYAWLPASWNHIGVAPHTCDNAGCHVAGSNQYYKPTNHQTTPYLDRNVFYCDECHNYVSWVPAQFIHDRPSPSGVCMGCHDGSNAPGKSAGHIATTADCNSCHTSTVSWLGALGAMPSNHIPFNPGVVCNNCHVGAPGALVNTVTLHTFSVATHTCAECHISPTPYSGNNQQTKSSHEGSSGNNCTTCHTHQNAGGYTSWGG